MEVCFTFQWGWFVFQMGGGRGGFIYKCVCGGAGGCAIGGGLGFGAGGGWKKIVGGGVCPPHPCPPPLWETLCVHIELLLCMLSSVVHVLCMYVLFYKHY